MKPLLSVKKRLFSAMEFGSNLLTFKNRAGW